LGDAWVTQASSKRHAREAQASNGESGFVCNKSWKKAGVGQGRRSGNPVIGKSGDQEKQIPTADLG
jgi:hypothetical protein